MEISDIKNYIYENGETEHILTEIGCHHIVRHTNLNGTFYTCGNYDGDNPTAISVYESPTMHVVNYTRNIVDKFGISDIISLVCFNKKLYLESAAKFICDVLGIQFYDDEDQESDEISRIFKDRLKQQNEIVGGINPDKLLDHNKPLFYDTPELTAFEQEKQYLINQNYLFAANDLFEKDGISPYSQQKFGLAMDYDSNRIIIPITNFDGRLVGIKGRLYKEEPTEWKPKYIYLKPCIKSNLLFGFNKDCVQLATNTKSIYIFESEKSVMVMDTNNHYHKINKEIASVSIGGHDISLSQLFRLESYLPKTTKIIFCYDKDVDKDQYIKEYNKAVSDMLAIPEILAQETLYYMYDTNNILNEKESPCDNLKKWEYLLEHNVYNIYDTLIKEKE